MDRGAWRATVHGVTKSWTPLNDQNFHFSFIYTQSKVFTDAVLASYEVLHFHDLSREQHWEDSITLSPLLACQSTTDKFCHVTSNCKCFQVICHEAFLSLMSKWAGVSPPACIWLHSFAGVLLPDCYGGRGTIQRSCFHDSDGSVCVCVRVCVAQSCPTLCNSMDCCLPGSSVNGTLQARILEWVTIPFSRGSSQPSNLTWVSCIAHRFFTI